MAKDEITQRPSGDLPDELDIPDGVLAAREAVEIIRAWIADGALMVSLNSDAFDDRCADWGRVLGQIAHHVARAAALNGRMTEVEAFRLVRSGLDAVIPRTQPTMSGHVRGRTSH